MELTEIVENRLKTLKEIRFLKKFRSEIIYEKDILEEISPEYMRIIYFDIYPVRKIKELSELNKLLEKVALSDKEPSEYQKFENITINQLFYKSKEVMLGTIVYEDRKKNVFHILNPKMDYVHRIEIRMFPDRLSFETLHKIPVESIRFL